MGTSQVKITDVVASFSGVSKILNRISDDFADFKPRGPFRGSPLNIEIKQLSVLLIENVQYALTSIEGSLPAKMGVVKQSLAGVIKKLSHPPSGLVAKVSIGFEERSSKQSKRNFDSLGWKTKGGRFLFAYAANGSKARTDVPYRCEVITRLIAQLQLPLSIKSVPDGFILERTSAGVLEIHMAGGLNDENPSSFSCEIDTDDAERIGALVLKSLEVMGSGKIFEYTWAVYNDLMGRVPDAITDGIETIRFASSANLTAESYEIQSLVTVQRLEDLDAIRLALPAKEEIVVQVGAFKYESDQFANVRVRAGTNGYRVELESRNPIPSGLTAKLGIE